MLPCGLDSLARPNLLHSLGLALHIGSDRGHLVLGFEHFEWSILDEGVAGHCDAVDGGLLASSELKDP